MGFPRDWNTYAEKAALAKVLGSKAAVRISFSLWNIVESSREYPQNAEALGRFLDEQAPTWMHDRRVIQKAEVRNFVYSNVLGKADKTSAVPVFANNLSEIAHLLMPRELPRIGENAQLLCKELTTVNDKAYSTLREAEVAVPDALRTLAKAKKEGKLTREIQQQTLLEWIGLSIPERNPDGRPFRMEERSKLLDQCVRRNGELLHACPSMLAEDLMEGYRTEDTLRNPKASDAIDLQHVVPALAYCDAIVTNDGYLKHHCERYSNEAKRNIVVARSLSDAVSALSI